jgi:hypothetical protein
VIVVIVAITGIGIGWTFQPTLIAFQAHCTKSHRAVVISNRNFFLWTGRLRCYLASNAPIKPTEWIPVPGSLDVLSSLAVGHIRFGLVSNTRCVCKGVKGRLHFTSASDWIVFRSLSLHPRSGSRTAKGTRGGGGRTERCTTEVRRRSTSD